MQRTSSARSLARSETRCDCHFIFIIPLSAAASSIWYYLINNLMHAYETMYKSFNLLHVWFSDEQLRVKNLRFTLSPWLLILILFEGIQVYKINLSKCIIRFITKIFDCSRICYLIIDSHTLSLKAYVGFIPLPTQISYLWNWYIHLIIFELNII